MKSSIWLILLQQVLLISARPHRKIGQCSAHSKLVQEAAKTGVPSWKGDATPALFNGFQPSPSQAVAALPIFSTSLPDNTAQVLAPLGTQFPDTKGTFVTGLGIVNADFWDSGRESYDPLPLMTSQVQAQVPILTTPTNSGTAQILPAFTTKTPQTTGAIITKLSTSGHGTPLLNTSISSPSTTISVESTAVSIPFNQPSSMVEIHSDNIFVPVDTAPPPAVLGSRPDHPVRRLGIRGQSSPLSTNKFYANFLLGSQNQGTWTHPYSLAWSRGHGSTSSWGMAISHIDSSQRVFGPDANTNPVQYVINPIDVQSLVLSAVELGSATTLTTDSLTDMSVNVNLLAYPGEEPVITFPLVQGMGFVTAVYNGATPILQSGVLFRSMTIATYSPQPGVTKYTIELVDGKTWLLYAYSSIGAQLEFTVVNSGLAQATSNFVGIIQIAKTTSKTSEDLYDASCGVYAPTARLSATAQGTLGSYTLSFSKRGRRSAPLLMFALPHHIASFDDTTRSASTSIQLDTTTKGVATAVVADSWTLQEALPVNLSFAPGRMPYSQAAIDTIASVAVSEVSQNMSEQTNLNSMYYSGKALAKFAGIIYTISDVLRNQTLAQAGLNELKSSFALFANNIQQFPLVYETAWGGVVSTASYTLNDAGADFGNTYYNDHHFHYGYFIYTAAVIGYLDPSWLATNKEYVNALVRDIANPSAYDTYFPVSRMFDWYHGHSWAHGLYETADGKDEESSSEDTMAAYAIKMWGHVIGDANMEARGNLQLAVLNRTLQSYFLYTADNTIEPANFIGNKVSGILFENKIDHVTYFGNVPAWIQGIHMLPLLPHSTLTRTKEFVTQEWNTYFSNGRVDTVEGGWRGILYANLALIDPTTAWNFFSQANFDMALLDGGASLTWYLAWAAGLGARS